MSDAGAREARVGQTAGADALRSPRARAWTLFAWFLAFAHTLRPIWGVDIGFHVAIGRQALSAQGLTGTDVLSAAHPDAPWAPFQLGYELVVAWLDGLAGADGLRVAHAAAFATGFVLIGRALWRVVPSRAAWLLLAACFLAAYDERLRLRPHVLNLLMEGALLLPLATGRWRANPRRWALALGLATFAWAFGHAMGALWAVAVAGTVLVGGADRSERRWGAVFVGAAVVGVAAAPGALAGIAHVLSIQGQWGPFVPELRPSWAWFGPAHASMGPLAWLQGTLPWVAVLAVLAAWATERAPDARARLLTAAGFAFGSVWMVRLGTYAVFALALCGPELAALARRAAEPTRRVAAASAVLLALTVLGTLGARLAPRWSATNPWTTTFQPGYFPTTEAGLLLDAGISGRILNSTDWGGYLLWRLHPESTVMSDGRVTFQPDVGELLIADQDPRQRVAVSHEARRRYGVDLMVRPKGRFPEGAGWELLLRGPTADVWSVPGRVFDARQQALGRVLSTRRGGATGK